MSSRLGAVLLLTVALVAAAPGSPSAAEESDPVVIGSAPGAPVIVADRAATKPHKSGPDNQTPSWANNSLTGYCGQIDGGYVIAAQLFLYAYGSYPSPIDNYWGSRSHNALLNYQANRGNLQRDGCAGPQTWDDMQRQATYVGTSSECSGSGSLDVYSYRRGSRWSYYHRSTRSLYWYADTYLQPRGGPVAERLYRFSDGLVGYC